MTVLGPIGELAAHAHAYADAGLEVFPLKADKTPWTRNGMLDATTDHDAIDRWWAEHPDALIGCRIDPGLVVIDIDPRHGGLETWKALRAEAGPAWPDTRAHLSGREDSGGHSWWIRPDDRLNVKRLDEWARERGLGMALGNGRWTSGLDLLHYGHRYTILPPSPHAATGRPYRWIGGRGLELDPAPMPALVADLITAEPPALPAAPRETSSDPSSPADWFSSRTSWPTLLVPAGWKLVAGDGDSDGSRWRHPTATTAYSATVRHHLLFVYSTSTAFEPTGGGSTHGYTPFRALAVLRFGGDMSEAAKWAREERDGPVALSSRSFAHAAFEEQVDYARRASAPSLNPAPEAPTTPSEPPCEAQAPMLLPDVLWDSREALTQIRHAAQSRVVAPDAVLAAVLARVAAITPHVVELPAIVGRACGLTFYSALVGPPSAGKSAAAGIAAELVPAPSGIFDGLPIGSGEGMTEILYETEKDEKGKVARRLAHHAAIFYIDEGQVLAELGSRSGSTLMTTLRSAWTNGDLGAANASSERRRIVHGHQYVYGVILGVQPEKAAGLLGDAAGGTPQRFLWHSAIDPTLPEDAPEWPGPLAWEAPTPRGDDWTIRGNLRRVVVPVDAAIVAEVRAERLRAARGGDVVAGDEHRFLLRLKVAALLGILDGRLDVNLEDWHLADLIVATSSRVRGLVENTLREESARADHAIAERQARRELTVDGARERKALGSAARAMARKVVAHCVNPEPTHGPECQRSCLILAVAGRDRKVVSTDEAIAEAVRNRWVEEVGDLFRPGPSRPA